MSDRQGSQRPRGLHERIVRAGMWTLGGHAIGQILRLSSNLIMTRLLVPEMFGLVALANIVLVGLHLLSDIGLSQGLIQSRRGGDPRYFNTVWCVQIVRGALVWLIALALACSVYALDAFALLPRDSVYAHPVLPYVIGVLAFNSLIGGFTSTKLAMASRELSLGRITFIELSTQVLGLVVMVCWALIDKSIWALVAGSLFASVLKVVLSHSFLDGASNSFAWNREALREILSFGKWIVLSSVLGYLALNLDRLMLGGMADAHILGLYAIAFFLVNAVEDALNKLFAQVAFPVFSEIARARPSELRAQYYKFRLPLDCAALIAMGMLFSGGSHLVDILYDDRYLPAGAMIQILCLTLFSARFGLANQCFLARGNSKWLFPISIFRIVFLVVLMPIAFTTYGLTGALWIVSGSTLVGLPYVFFLKHKEGLVDWLREFTVLPVIGVGYALGLLFNLVF